MAKQVPYLIKMPGLIVGKEDEMKHWVQYIRNRVNNYNKNFMGITVGQTGSGKSWSNLEMADKTDKRYEFTEERCYFSISALIKDIRDKKLRKGSSAVVEEVGILANARKWQSKENIALSYLTQAFRKERHIVFFNTPSWRFFDSASKRLLHARFETIKIDQGTSECIIKPFLLQWTDYKDEPYKKYLRVAQNRRVAPVKEWRVAKPRKNLIIAYEKKKSDFLEDLYNKLGSMIDPTKEDKKKEHKHGYRYRIKTQDYICNCGFITKNTQNPKEMAEIDNIIIKDQKAPLLNLIHKEGTNTINEA